MNNQDQPLSDNKKCSACGEGVVFLGVFPVRAGGRSGNAIYAFGPWLERQEKVFGFDMFRCSKCAHLDFFDQDFSLPSFVEETQAEIVHEEWDPKRPAADIKSVLGGKK